VQTTQGERTMPDYKEMYLKLFRAAEKAENILIAAQQECEEMYLSAPETEIKIPDIKNPQTGNET
jgi:hypothetical protein